MSNLYLTSRELRIHQSDLSYIKRRCTINFSPVKLPYDSTIQPGRMTCWTTASHTMQFAFRRSNLPELYNLSYN